MPLSRAVWRPPLPTQSYTGAGGPGGHNYCAAFVFVCIRLPATRVLRPAATIRTALAAAPAFPSTSTTTLHLFFHLHNRRRRGTPPSHGHTPGSLPPPSRAALVVGTCQMICYLGFAPTSTSFSIPSSTGSSSNSSTSTNGGAASGGAGEKESASGSGIGGSGISGREAGGRSNALRPATHDVRDVRELYAEVVGDDAGQPGSGGGSPTALSSHLCVVYGLELGLESVLLLFARAGDNGGGRDIFFPPAVRSASALAVACASPNLSSSSRCASVTSPRRPAWLQVPRAEVQVVSITTRSNTYTNATWATVSVIPLAQCNSMERECLVGCDYSLLVSQKTYEDWGRLLKGLVCVHAGCGETHAPPRRLTPPAPPVRRKRANENGGNAGGGGKGAEAADEPPGADTRDPALLVCDVDAAGSGHAHTSSTSTSSHNANANANANSNSNTPSYPSTTTSSASYSSFKRGTAGIPKRQRIPTQRGPALALIAAFAGAALHGVPQSGRRDWGWDAVGAVWAISLSSGAVNGGVNGGSAGGGLSARGGGRRSGSRGIRMRVRPVSYAGPSSSSTSTSTSSSLLMFNPTSMFTPYAVRDRERERERERRRGRSIYGVWRDGDDPVTAVEARSTPAQQSYEYVPPPPSTVVQPRYAAQIAAVSASSNNSGSQPQQHGHQQTTHLSTSVSSSSPYAHAYQHQQHALDHELARVTVRAPARGDAGAAAFVVGTRDQSQYPAHMLTARWDYANAGDGGVVQQPQEAAADKVVDKDEDHQKIINWLSPINFFLRHAAITEMREKGTGEWLLKHPLFEKWESGLGNTLWCHGIPGAGKTVLASMVVNYLSTQSQGNNTGVACIYLSHKEVDDQTPSRLLAGLWRQLVLDQDIGFIAEKLYKQHRGKGTAPSLEEVVNVLNSSLERFSRVFIIVDAMDECPEFQREILLQQLAAMAKNVNLMITSRPNISTDSSAFPNLETLDIQAVQGDIQTFIHAQIKSSPHLSRHTRKKPALREEILTKVIDTADGMFLLAKLYMQFLSTKNTIGDVREALKEAPKDLYDTYHLAMQQIEVQNEDNRKTARSTLIWVANAKRLLTVSELTTALAIRPGARCLDEDYLLDIETVLAICAGLVIVDKESSVVRLVHYTTQQYLDSIQAVLFPDAQTEITCTLLTFLAFDGYPDPSWDLEDLPPLAEYSQHCLAHAAGQPEVQLREILLKFLDWAFQWVNRINQEYHSWKWHSKPWNYSDQPLKPSALWIAAAANLVETTRFLLKGAPLLQHSRDSGIIVASYYGHKEIVSLLLERGADVNAAGVEYESALQAAIAKGHTEIVDILLKKGADVNTAGGYYGSALQAATHRGHTEIVDILLENGAHVNAAGGIYGSALQAAAAEGHPEIVNILLENGADVNAVGGLYGSAFQAATFEGHTEIVDILLEKGADVNAARGYFGSALQAAAAEGHPEIVDILLEKGADVNAAGAEDGGALQAAAPEGHTEIVGILLEKGADVNAAQGHYGSVLQAAAAEGHTEIVEILLKKGVDINAAGEPYGSGLQAAAYGGHMEIVNILLEKGADINAAGGEYGSALQAAATWGHTEIVDILLKKGADVNAGGGEYGSALHAAAALGHTKIVDMLLERGAQWVSD
ncbi:hypothetical protein B0H16DRAFT_1728330 [Mycena metata]|uniref:NACHT domain-containing protein n=1 Tax=Mycena metata TaxID=1033252 RepID=A0AAD7IFW8_9AGAR|nr:hypothetical protein B0H16DRAFT_1728330 [Mycena metata]